MILIQKKSGGLWQYYRDKPASINNDVIIDFAANNNSISFKFKQQITGQRVNNLTKEIEILVPLIYLSILREHLKSHLTTVKLYLDQNINV